MKADDEKSAKRDRVQREREQRRATELRTNLKRRKAKARAESGMKTCAEVTPDEERIEPQES